MMIAINYNLEQMKRHLKEESSRAEEHLHGKSKGRYALVLSSLLTLTEACLSLSDRISELQDELSNIQEW